MGPVRALAVALLVSAAGPASVPAGEERCPLDAAGGAAAIVAPFPARDSPEGAADLAIVLWEQRTRTPEEVARARSEEVLSLEDFAAVLGPGFVPARRPLTEALLARAARAARPCVGALKRGFARPRPYAADPRVSPAVEREDSASYPSGHATRAALFAALLAELAPARREVLLRRGAQIGADRVIAGVHYPSDVAAGQRLGDAVAQVLLAEPDFREALEGVRAREWRDGAAPRRRTPTPTRGSRSP
jgi:acid phosphatase (class A)